MGGGVLQLVLACAGVLLLYRILARLRPGAALQDAVVVITGASSGLGKGWRSADFFSSPQLRWRCSLQITSHWYADIPFELGSSWITLINMCLVVVQVLDSHHEQEVRFLCCRVCTGLPRRGGSPGAVWTRCSPPAAGGRGADSEFNGFTAAGVYAAEIYPLDSLLCVPLSYIILSEIQYLKLKKSFFAALSFIFKLQLSQNSLNTGIQRWLYLIMTVRCEITLLFCSTTRLTLPARLSLTWLTQTQWTELQRRSWSVMDKWMSSSTMLESATVAIYWIPTFQFSEMLWKQITLDPLLSLKVSEECGLHFLMPYLSSIWHKKSQKWELDCHGHFFRSLRRWTLFYICRSSSTY